MQSVTTGPGAGHPAAAPSPQDRKALDLIERGVITEDTQARVFLIGPDPTRYRVIVTGGVTVCSCPAGRHSVPCKHALAARMLIAAEKAGIA